MPLLPIMRSPHKILGSPAEEISLAEISRPAIQRLISAMRATLEAATDGVGLAAPQVGQALRIFIVSEEVEAIDAPPASAPKPAGERRARDAPDAAGTEQETARVWEHFVFINPVLKKQSRKKIEMAEGCLSLPGKLGSVARAEKIHLEWLDEQGRKHRRGFTKFFARAIQHELDHLDGILISDRARRLYEARDHEQ